MPRRSAVWSSKKKTSSFLPGNILGLSCVSLERRTITYFKKNKNNNLREADAKSGSELAVPKREKETVSQLSNM